MNPRLAENLAEVRARIAAAAQRSGRPVDAVRLVGVTKYVSLEVSADLARCGLVDLGESRPQQLVRKAEAWQQLASHPGPVHWHLVGHLQRNKLARTLPLVGLWHSADSRRVLQAASAWAVQAGRQVPTLIEVHLAPDATKGGFPAEELASLGDWLAQLPGITVRGLMTMARLEGGPATARIDFARLRQVRDSLRGVWPESLGLDELSMGMSDDFEVAIEEGSTIVRLGSVLFAGIDPEPSRQEHSP